jgi:hypothetical protein
MLSDSFLSVSSATSAVRSIPSGRRRLVAVAPLATQDFLGRDVPAPTHTINYFGVGDVSSPWPPSQPKTSWDETSQPPSRPSMTSGLATSRLHTSHAMPVISSGFPLPIPQPVSKTLKGFQTVAGGKAARPPPPVPRPQNVQPPPLAEGVGGGGIPESPQAGSPDAARCSTIPRRSAPSPSLLPGAPRTRGRCSDSVL